MDSKGKKIAILLVLCSLVGSMAAVAAVKRELGTKWAIAVAVGQCLLAWVVAFLAYWVLLLAGMQ